MFTRPPVSFPFSTSFASDHVNRSLAREVRKYFEHVERTCCPLKRYCGTMNDRFPLHRSNSLVHFYCWLELVTRYRVVRVSIWLHQSSSFFLCGQRAISSVVVCLEPASKLSATIKISDCIFETRRHHRKLVSLRIGGGVRRRHYSQWQRHF